MDSVAGDIAVIKNTLTRMEEFLKHSAMKTDIAKVEERLAHTPTKAEMYIAGGTVAVAVIGLMAKGLAGSSEIDRREGYEVRLLAALLICTAPLTALMRDAWPIRR